MTKYRVEKTPVKKHSWIPNPRNFGHKEYHEYGRKQVLANKKQANKKVMELRAIGYPCERSLSHPYVIILGEGL